MAMSLAAGGLHPPDYGDRNDHQRRTIKAIAATTSRQQIIGTAESRALTATSAATGMAAIARVNRRGPNHEFTGASACRPNTATAVSR